MKITKQGDNYEGQDDTELEDEVDEEFDEEDDEEFDEDDDDEDGAKINTIFGLPKKIVFVGAAGIFVIVALFAVMNITKKPKADEESTETATEDVQPYEEFMAEGGYEEEFADPNATGEVTDQQMTMKDVLISDEDATKLGTYGYTSSEIELAKEYGITADEMISNAQSRKEASVRSTIKKLSDTGSVEYQNLMNQSYLGQDKNKEPVDQTKVENPTYYETSQIINADYVKCPTYGLQLFLKCKIYDGVYIWYQVTPDRWVNLPQSGNIVLSITLKHYGDSIYLVDVQETTSSPGTDSVQSDNLVNQPVE